LSEDDHNALNISAAIVDNMQQQRGMLTICSIPAEMPVC